MTNEPQLPGDRIREMRHALGYSMKDLAESCNPPMDYSTIGRIEKNKGYTKDSLERFAEVFKCEVSDFFLYEPLKGYSQLPAEAREDVAKYINTLLLAYSNKTA